VVHDGPFLQIANDGTCRFAIPAVANYLIRDAQEIIIEPSMSPEASDIRLFLFGTVFGILCHQRGFLPLHASCVGIGGCAIAFAGASGMGKSTLAAALVQRGYPLLADDVCVVDWRTPGPPMVIPSIIRLKLWRDVLDALDLQIAPEARVRVGLEKYTVMQTPLHVEPLPLAAIYHLCEAKPLDKANASPSGLDVLLQLRDATYRWKAAYHLGLQHTIFAATSRIAALVPNQALVRSTDLADLNTLVECVLAWHARPT
jgi:hypothetical protein